MEPHIRYATTSDGVSIAYAVFGQGTPLVYLAAGAGVHLYSHFSLARLSTDQLGSSGFQVIRYDGRGTGSSDRAAWDFSLEGKLRDLEAVADRLNLDRVALASHQEGGLTAVAYAARHPERVSHLLLRNPWASAADLREVSPGQRALKALRPVAEENWELVTLNIAQLGFGLTDSDIAREFAAAMQSGMSAEVWVQREEAHDGIDVTELLGAVKAPTLIIYDTDLQGRRSISGGDLRAAATKVAAAIPGARLLATDDYTAAVAEFVREGEQLAAPPAHPEPGELSSGTAIILFADIVDSTALTERLGDAAFRDQARDVAAALRSIIAENGGRTIEGPTLGDGVLAVFTSARQAIEAALACGRGGDDADLPLHLGLHAGDVIRESDPDGRANVYGGAVNIASRISGLSAPGEVLVSDTVRSLARTSAGVRFEDRAEQALKGVGEAVRVWAVREGNEAEMGQAATESQTAFRIRPISGEGFELLRSTETYAQLAIKNVGTTLLKKSSVRLEGIDNVLHGHLMPEQFVQPRLLRWSSRERSAYGDEHEWLDIPGDGIERFLDVAVLDRSNISQWTIVTADPHDRITLPRGWFRLRLVVLSESDKPESLSVELRLDLGRRTDPPPPLMLNEWQEGDEKRVGNVDKNV